jgi:hypothetical protein
VRSGEYGGCGKTVTGCFASSSWTNTEQCAGLLSCSNSQFFCIKAYDELNCLDRKISPCSGVCLQSLLLQWIPCEQFQMSWKTVQALPCRLTCPVTVSSFLVMMAISRWPILTSVEDHTENTMFCLLLYSSWEMSHLWQHYQSGNCKCSCNRHVGLASGHMEHCWVTWDMFRSSDRILW